LITVAAAASRSSSRGHSASRMRHTVARPGLWGAKITSVSEMLPELRAERRAERKSDRQVINAGLRWGATPQRCPEQVTPSPFPDTDDILAPHSPDRTRFRRSSGASAPRATLRRKPRPEWARYLAISRPRVRSERFLALPSRSRKSGAPSYRRVRVDRRRRRLAPG